MAQRFATVVMLAVAAALLCWLLTGLYRRAMLAYGHLEPPNQRSMHAAPVPAGAGVAIVTVALCLWLLPQGFILHGRHLLLAVTLAALTAVSWADDRLDLSPGPRLAAQILAIAALLASLGPEMRACPALPLTIERFLLGLGWLWFINLFNFMDGIDGLAGSEAIAVATGYSAIAILVHLDGPLWELTLIVAAATLGYLFWNWHPARVFMGDAGSIPLGFLLGWLMIDLALNGQWPAAVILPLYFAADATLTLAKRVLRGEKPWQAHRSHFYQRAVLGGAAPMAVVWRVNAANVALLGLAILSLHYRAIALIGAAAIVMLLLIDLKRMARARVPSGP